MREEQAPRPTALWIGPSGRESSTLAGRAREAIRDWADLKTWRQEEPGSASIRLVLSLQTADVVLADLRGNNPNVMYEAGLAHAFERPVVFITDSADELPFDVRDQQSVAVESDADGRPTNPEMFDDQVREQVRSALASAPVTAVTVLRLRQVPARGDAGGSSASPWRDLALVGTLPRLDARTAEVDVRVVHPRYGLGQVVGTVAAPPSVVVEFADSTQRFVLPDRQLFLAEVQPPA